MPSFGVELFSWPKFKMIRQIQLHHQNRKVECSAWQLLANIQEFQLIASGSDILESKLRVQSERSSRFDRPEHVFEEFIVGGPMVTQAN